MTTLVDERGRVVLPKDIRERFGLEPGAPVIIEATDDGVRIRRAISRREAFQRLAGAIPKTAPGPYVDPLALKRIWEPRV